MRPSSIPLTLLTENSNSILIIFDQNMIINEGIYDIQNYSISEGVSITGLEVLDKRRVRLFTTTQLKDKMYSLRVGRTL